MKSSNVAIKSNIYVNVTKSYRDEAFIRNVRGYEAIRIVNEQLGNLYDHLLSVAQREELAYGKPECTFDKSGAKPFGAVIDGSQYRFVCRCENTGCHRYQSDCSKSSIFQSIERQAKSTQDRFEYIIPAWLEQFYCVGLGYDEATNCIE